MHARYPASSHALTPRSITNKIAEARRTPGFFDALAPLQRKVGRPAYEREILRVSGTISRGQEERARRIALDWVRHRAGGRLPDEAINLQSFEALAGGRINVGIRLASDDTDLWAVRADDPDKQIAGRTWTTEVAIGVKGEAPPRLSLRLLVNTAEEKLEIEVHTPALVGRIAETCGFHIDGIRLCQQPNVVGDQGEAEDLVDYLLDPRRSIPVFALSVPDGAPDPRSPLIDADQLARATLGLAQVYILPNQFTYALTHRFGRLRTCFGGAVRAYMPGFTEDAPLYDHRLVLAGDIGDGRAVLAWMRNMAASYSLRRSRLGTDVLAFSDVRTASHRLSQQRLQRDGGSDRDQIILLQRMHADLQAALEQEKSALVYFDEQHKLAEERAENAEAQARAYAVRIQQLLDQLDAAGAKPDANIAIPSTWTDFTDWVDTSLAGRVTLTTAARRNLRNPLFGDVRLAAECLLWLANDCRARRLKGGGKSMRDEPVIDRVRNAACGSDTFQVDWHGRRHTVDWHIKTGGNTRDPERCLRIYYFWDPASQQIVIADMPGHRRTEAS